MGQIEKILTAADPLIAGTSRQWIRYDIKKEEMVFFTSLDNYSISAVFIRFTTLEGPVFYYALNPKISYTDQEISNTFWNTKRSLIENDGRIVFSGRNVFKYLHLGEPFDKNSDDPLEDLKKLCMRIMETKSIVADAFSKNKIEKTFYALSVMEGNDEDEITLLLKDLYSDMLNL